MLYLILEGGLGNVVLEALLSAGFEVEALEGGLQAGERLALGRRLEREERVFPALEEPADFLVAVPDGSNRRRIAERWEGRGHRLARLIHPAAWVSPSALVEKGAVVLASALVQTEARVQKGAIIDPGAMVGQGCRIGEFARVSSGSHLGEGVEIGAGTWVGVGSTVREGVIIRERCVVGAGSVVMDDLPPDVVAHGNPCRVVRRIGRGPEGTVPSPP